MRWPIGGNFELPTWFITVTKVTKYFNLQLTLTGVGEYGRKSCVFFLNFCNDCNMLWLPEYTNNYYFTEISQNDASTRNNIKTTIKVINGTVNNREI
jgi:hypothetical protein